MGWDGEDYAEILSLFRQQTTEIHGSIMAAARAVCPSEARRFFEDFFQPLRFGAAFAGHVTGYYEPLLAGTAEADGEFKFPLFAPPPDLDHPWYSRREIEQRNILAGRDLELVYLKSRVDQYFVHIQGSVAVDYPDGRRARFGFAAKNGHPYRSIGHILVERGAIAAKDITADWVKSWLEAHPDEMDDLLWENPSFIFFAPRQTEGAFGAAGEVLTPNRSIAIDPAYIPYGLPVMLEAQGHAPRLYLAQDCGSAIKARSVPIFSAAPGRRRGIARGKSTQRRS